MIEDAFNGNSAASFSLGIHFTAVDRNDEEAARWFQLAAAEGHSAACTQLGHRYHRGLGVPQDDGTAAYWFHAGASNDSKDAMVALGLLYAAGRGVPQDWTAAVRWWKQARSGTGYPLASRFLGDAYVCGLGVPRNYERAMRAYGEAADRGEASASVQLGHMSASGCAPRNDKAAFAAYERAAEQNDPEAQIALSDLYRQGRGVEQAAYRAYFWARLAERRLPAGDLRDQANERAAQAARLLSSADIAAAETLVEAMVEGASRSRYASDRTTPSGGSTAPA